MRRIGVVAVLLISALFMGQSAFRTDAPAQSSLSQASSKPATIPAFDPTAMDKSVNPCDDFYRYACGGWMARNPIPADQGSWGRFNELREHNLDVLHEILEADSKPDAKRNPIAQKVGDFYAACMDEQTVNSLGAKPIEAELQRIAKISSASQLLSQIVHMHSVGVPALFRFNQSPDLHNAGMTIASLGQGGLGLPNKDYYTKTDAKSVEARERYVAHIQKMLQLLGDTSENAAAEAKSIMDIEMKLANASLDPVALRKPENIDHSMNKAEVDKLAPAFGFNRFFTEVGVPSSLDKINVSTPDFFKQANSMLSDVPLDQWKTYLRWNLVRAAAPHLSEPFVQEAFDFNDKYLGGQKEIQARWKRCVRLDDQLLGEALGQPYVDETFGAEGKQRTLKMVQAIEGAMGDDLQALPWMTPETKKASAVKLAGVSNKIGYPDHWRDYSKVTVSRTDFVGNVTRARNFEYQRNISKIGKPTDKTEWGMTPPTVNAYYSPQQNNIDFPAGILQPPFYDNHADDAVNFGGIGAVIGHELTHGFDDQGAKFDASGDLRNWWTADDLKEFNQRTGCIADEYSGFVAVDDLHVNGRLTLGENTADNGGLRISLMALHKQQGGKDVPKIDGFTGDQRFFLAFGQIWCQNQTPESARRQALGDPHSPGRYRVNGVVQNMPEFQKAFSCPAHAPMVSQNSCHVW